MIRPSDVFNSPLTNMNNVISHKLFCFFGIIKEVMSNGVVMVEPSVVGSKTAYFAVPCVLSTLASTHISVDVKPTVDDKVIVFSPRNYSAEMFKAENNETIVQSASEGYNEFTCIAFLANQFQTATHEKFFQVDETSMNLTYGKVLGKLDEEGVLHLENEKASLDVSAEGAIDVKNEKANVSVSDAGAIEIKNEKATITVGDDGAVSVETQGDATLKAQGNMSFEAQKFAFKTQAKDLKSIISDLIAGVKGIQTLGTGYSGTPVMSTVQVAAQLDALNGQLSTFFA